VKNAAKQIVSLIGLKYVKHVSLFILLTFCAFAEPVLLVSSQPVGTTFSVDAPQPPFRFEKEETGGTAPKIVVRDGSDRRWIVKFGPEGSPETFASRIVHAAGYHSEPAYYVAEGKVEGVSNLGRAAAHIKDGIFKGARFEYMNPQARYTDKHWSLTEPALKDTKELGALKALIALLSNWDVKPENMSVVELGGKQVFAITDWGRTMGRAEEITGRSQWDCASYAKDSEHFVEDVENGFVLLNYSGKQRVEVQRGVKLEHAKWLAQRLGQISDTQLADALRLSGATAEEVSCFGPAFRKRLQQLANAGAGGETIRSRKVTRTVTTQNER
jgi:hypothetical protein